MTKLERWKNRPVHKIHDIPGCVVFTYCGVDPARKGVQHNWMPGPNQSLLRPTCKSCLRAEREHRK